MKVRGRRVALILATVLPVLTNADTQGLRTEQPCPHQNPDQVDVDESTNVLSDTVNIAQDESDNSLRPQQRLETETVIENDSLPPLETEEPSQKIHGADRRAESSSHPAANKENGSDENNVPTKPGKPPDKACPQTQNKEDDHTSTSTPFHNATRNATSPDSTSEQGIVNIDDAKDSNDSNTENIGNTNSTGNESTPSTLIDTNSSTATSDTSTPRVTTEALPTVHIGQVEDDEDTLSRVSVDYASKSAGALIIERSPSFQGASNLLNGDRDKYAISPCEDKQFVVVSLSEDILVKQIKIANYERFSSTVKDFQVMGSQTLGTWVDLGTYTAKSGNGEQTFDLREPAWARYLKFKFLTRHGEEYYCTYSQIKVHGSTMVQGFHEHWKESEEQEGDGATQIESKDESQSVEKDQKGIVRQVDDDLTGDAKTNTKSAPLGETNRRVPQKATRSTRAKRTIHRETSEKKPTPIVFGSLTTSKGLAEKLCSNSTDIDVESLSALPRVSWKARLQRYPTGNKLKRLHSIGKSTGRLFLLIPVKPQNATDIFVSNSTVDIAIPQMAGAFSDAVSHLIGPELEELMIGQVFHSNTTPSVKVGSTKSDSPADSDEPSKKGHSNRGQNASLDQGHIQKEKKQVKASEKVPAAGIKVRPDRIMDGESKEPIQILDAPHLAKILEHLPSAECLSKLNFATFKANILASKKSPTGAGSSTASGSVQMEPIFKKLTDEIKSLQTSVSIHDQFSKSAVACYQSVLMDLVLQMETFRGNYEDRLAKLEDELHASFSGQIRATVYWFFHCLCTMATWIYSAGRWLYSSLQEGFIVFVEMCFTISATVRQNTIQYWPTIKRVLLSFKLGTRMGGYITPFVEHIDQVVLEMESTDSHEQTKKDDGMRMDQWLLPHVLPILFAGWTLRGLMGRILPPTNNYISITATKKGQVPSKCPGVKSDSEAIPELKNESPQK